MFFVNLNLRKLFTKFYVSFLGDCKVFFLSYDKHLYWHFFISIENFYLVQKRNKENLLKKFGRNPKSDRDWKDRKKIELLKKDQKIEKRSKE